MGINSATQNFKESVTKLVNESGLPPVNILLVLEGIQSEVYKIYCQHLQMENEIPDNNQKEEKG